VALVKLVGRVAGDAVDLAPALHRRTGEDLVGPDRRLSEHEFVAGDAYTIADMAIWPWYGGVVKGWLYEA
jgi:glutathione S-transferase